MPELSRDEAVEVLGPVGDVIIAEIIATGISKTELVEVVLVPFLFFRVELVHTKPYWLFR